MRQKTRISFLLMAISFLVPWLGNAGENQVLELDQSEVVRRVFEESRRGQHAQLRVAIAANEIDRAKSSLDFIFRASGSHEIDSNDTVVSVFGTRNDTTRFGASVTKNLSSGTGLSLGLDSTRQSSNSPFAPIDPAYDSGINFEIRQSLWRDAFGRDLRGRIKAAELQADAAEEGVAREIEGIALQAATTYWTWLTAIEDEKLAREAARRAREFVKITNTKKNYGTAEERDVFAAQANLARFEEEEIRARQIAEISETQLRNQILVSNEVSLRSKEKLPFKAASPLVEELLQKGRSQRGDLISAQKSLEATKQARLSAESSANPRLDLVTSLRLNGVDGEWGNSLGEPFGAKYPKFFVGAEIEFPWENRALGTEAKNLFLEERRRSLELDQLQDDLESEVLVVSEKLNHLNLRVRKLTQAERLEKKKLKAAEKDFERGRTDALTILLYQQELLRAQRNLLLTRSQLVLAGLEMSFVTGDLKSIRK